MFNLNRAMIIGNLTRDPELRYTPNGQPVTSFAVATNRAYNDKNGEQQKEVEFHDIVAWGKLAEISTQILSRGKKVYVEGRLKTRQWDAPDGSKKQKTEIVAENLIALDARGAESFGGEFTPQEAPKPVAPVAVEKEETEEISFDNEPVLTEEIDETAQAEAETTSVKKDKDGNEDIPF